MYINASNTGNLCHDALPTKKAFTISLFDEKSVKFNFHIV